MTHLDSVAFALRAHVLLVTVNPSAGLARGIVPAKTYEAMALGKHILCLAPAGSDLEELLAEYGNASFADSSSPDAICKAIKKLVEAHQAAVVSRSELPFMERRPDLRTHSRRQRTAEFIELVRELAYHRAPGVRR
jgi:glycosyltransferase involved in cell wall biosynthesis